MLRKYPSIYNWGHKAVREICSGPCTVQEKIDGSQISFGKIDGVLRICSKNKEVDLDNPDNLFGVAVERIRAIEGQLLPGCIYRGEYFLKPKHNCLAYDRLPKNNIMLFDVEVGEGTYWGHEMVAAEADRLGFEAVARCYLNPINDETLKAALECTSKLGGQKIEGLVIKNYDIYGPDKKILIAKYVSPEFKEVSKKEWKVNNPGKKDIIERLVERYRTQARWNKAVIHLKESGELREEPSDIGRLIKEVNADILRECEEEIKEEVFRWVWGEIGRGALTKGLAEWYKEKLKEG